MKGFTRCLVAVVLAIGVTACGGSGGGSGVDSGTPSGPTDTVPPITNTTWAPGVSVGPVFIGEASATLRAELGAPDGIRHVPAHDSIPSTMAVEYRAPGLHVYFVDRDNDQQLDDAETVDSIVLMDLLSNPAISHSFRYRGLGLGSTRAEVLQGMGRPFIDTASSSAYPASGTLFGYDASGGVTAIVVSKR